MEEEDARTGILITSGNAKCRNGNFSALKCYVIMNNGTQWREIRREILREKFNRDLAIFDEMAGVGMGGATNMTHAISSRSNYQFTKINIGVSGLEMWTCKDT